MKTTRDGSIEMTGRISTPLEKLVDAYDSVKIEKMSREDKIDRKSEGHSLTISQGDTINVDAQNDYTLSKIKEEAIGDSKRLNKIFQ